MKEIKFKTSKGEFVVYDDANGIGKHLPYDLLTKIGYVKNLTEEQAIDIIEGYNGYYNTYTEEECGNITNTAIKSFYSLLKSKGIHLYKNPYEGYNDILLSDEDNKKINDFKKGLLEQKTFYNPYIFKLNE